MERGKTLCHYRVRIFQIMKRDVPTISVLYFMRWEQFILVKQNVL